MDRSRKVMSNFIRNETNYAAKRAILREASNSHDSVDKINERIKLKKKPPPTPLF